MFSFLLGAVTTFRITLFMIGLAFGRSVVWSGQSRDAHGVAWSTAVTGLWPPFLFGSRSAARSRRSRSPTFLWSLPLTFGYLVAVPFAVATASPVLGGSRQAAPLRDPGGVRAAGRDPRDRPGRLIMVLPKGSAAALSKSLRLYHGRRGPQRGDGCALRRFLEPGDLAFDIGAHVGDRISSFRRLGARVSSRSSRSPARPGSCASSMGATPA